MKNTMEPYNPQKLAAPYTATPKLRDLGTYHFAHVAEGAVVHAETEVRLGFPVAAADTKALGVAAKEASAILETTIV